ncbi:hypothetical protein LWM68_34875 [Niabella sp. W65]|nr:hypothetical protein [Niabella sp. W65]MCH7367489.1 hypothetical protein [Niabella sp. W65]ULT43567.1 hypothetical protein KRR40_09130 [Niabella sp. I65]
MNNRIFIEYLTTKTFQILRMPSFKIKHITRYSYSSPAVECTNQIMLYPIQDALQHLVSHKITITKNPG